jgi:predicted nucleotidyltransferase component of viral defense system
MTNNKEASVKQRLLNLARDRKEDYNFILRQYAMQRLLYRLSVSEFSEQFLLKGALLFWIWNQDFHRPTIDIDLLGSGNNDPEYLLNVFRIIIANEQDDGLHFDSELLRAAVIKEDAKYQGVRISGKAFIGNTRIPFQIDIGFGDVVTPQPERKILPSFLDAPAPELAVYPVYTVIAEKFQAMVALDLANSRMKDFYDLWIIASMMELEGYVLAKAIAATFGKRETMIKTDGLSIFSDSFMHNESKQVQWQAFLRKNQLGDNVKFSEIMLELKKLLEPAYLAIAQGDVFDKKWSPESWIWQD